jgi:hypothetical protein
MFRRKILLILFGLGPAASVVCAAQANDLSMITLNLNGNASLLVADEQGHLTGVDPTIPKMYQEIPESNGGAIPAALSVSIAHPQGVTYQVIVVGMNIAPYTLAMAAYSKDGTPQPKIAIEGNTAPGVKTSYDITFKPDGSAGGDASTIILHQ